MSAICFCCLTVSILVKIRCIYCGRKVCNKCYEYGAAISLFSYANHEHETFYCSVPCVNNFIHYSCLPSTLTKIYDDLNLNQLSSIYGNIYRKQQNKILLTCTYKIVNKEVNLYVPIKELSNIVIDYFKHEDT